MRTAPSPLLPLLRSRVQGDLLALAYLNPDQEFSLTQAARRTRASVKAVHKEASRLVENGLLRDRRLGNSRMISAPHGSPLTRPLTDLLAVTYGPLPVLTRCLRGLPGVDRAFIYGSWAARYEGEPGPVPVDVDVLIVGTADPDLLEERARDAEAKLGREVNVRRVRPSTWGSCENDPFMATVRSRPLVELRLDEEENA